MDNILIGLVIVLGGLVIALSIYAGLCSWSIKKYFSFLIPIMVLEFGVLVYLIRSG